MFAYLASVDAPFAAMRVQANAETPSTQPATLYVHGFTELMHFVSDFPQSQTNLRWAAAYQGLMQLQGHAQQCFAAEVLPVLMAHYVFGLGPSTAKVCVCVCLCVCEIACMAIMLQYYSLSCQAYTDMTTGVT